MANIRHAAITELRARSDQKCAENVLERISTALSGRGGGGEYQTVDSAICAVEWQRERNKNWINRWSDDLEAGRQRRS